MTLSPRVAALLLLLAVAPAVHAGGTLDAGVAVVHVEDRFASCATPVAGFCLFDVRGGSPGDMEVDTWQRFDYVGVATDASEARRLVGEAWLLPDLEFTVYGRELYLRHPAFDLATQAHGEAPQPSEDVKTEMTGDDVAVHHPVRTNEPLDPRTRREPVFVYNDTGYVQYDRAGPLTGDTEADTDFYVTDVPNLCEDEACRDAAQLVVDNAPNVRFGANVADVQVAMDPENLTPPSAARFALNGSEANFSKLPPLAWGGAVEDDATGGPARADEDAPAQASAGPRGPRNERGPGADPAAVRVQSPPPRTPPVDRTAAVVATVATATALLMALGFALYSRFNTRAEALRSETRDALLNLVRDRPGVCVADAAEALGLSRNAVQHHVRVLERVGLVRVVEERNLRTLYPPGVQVQQAPAWLRRNATCIAILRALAESPAGLPRDELHRRFAEVPERTRNHHLKRLLQVGAVVADETPEGVKTLRLPPQPPARDGAAPGAGAA